MKTAAVIAEYNPFHNGHKYHLEQTRIRTGADYLLVLMSGDFTQRGEPALLDKYFRAEMALRDGADLALELPVCFAASSAPYFAEGAVALLDKLGVVDALSFGCEWDRLPLLQELAALLAREPAGLSERIRRSVKKGSSFARARAEAIIDYTGQNNTGLSETALSALLSSPNAILALEYCKSLFKRKSRIAPCAIPRRGGAYHDAELQEEYSSALAIRTRLGGENAALPKDLLSQIPVASFQIMKDQWRKTFPIFPEDLSVSLQYKLLTSSVKELMCCADVSESLANRIGKRLSDYQDLPSFCALLKTKELSYSRISRALLHIYLNLTKADMELFCSTAYDYAGYARILGFRREASPLLSAIKAHSGVPLISKLADAPGLLSETANRQLALDGQAARLYQAVIFQKYKNKLPVETQRQLVIL